MFLIELKSYKSSVYLDIANMKDTFVSLSMLCEHRGLTWLDSALQVIVVFKLFVFVQKVEPVSFPFLQPSDHHHRVSYYLKGFPGP